MDSQFIALIIASFLPFCFYAAWKIRKHIKNPETRNKYSLFSIMTVAIAATAVGFSVRMGHEDWMVYSLAVFLPLLLFKTGLFIARLITKHRDRPKEMPIAPPPPTQGTNENFTTSENLEIF